MMTWPTKTFRTLPGGSCTASSTAPIARPAFCSSPGGGTRTEHNRHGLGVLLDQEQRLVRRRRGSPSGQPLRRIRPATKHIRVSPPRPRHGTRVAAPFRVGVLGRMYPPQRRCGSHQELGGVASGLARNYPRRRAGIAPSRRTAARLITLTLLAIIRAASFPE